MTDRDYIKAIQSRLSEKRVVHSLEVAKEAKRLAPKYGSDEKKAYTAGLLHDIMKDTPEEEMLRLAAELGVIFSEIERAEQKLWHAKVGSAYAEYKLDVHDLDIISAIRYHTTARAGMSPLEKTLYLADFTSADRDYPGVEEMRAAVGGSLNDAMEAALKFTITDLLEKGSAIHPDTVSAYNELMLEKSGGNQ